MASITALFTRPEFMLAMFLALAVLGLLAWRLRLRWLPAWLLRAGILGAALVAFFAAQQGFDAKPLPQRQVMLVDQSDSLAEGTRQQLLAQADRWQAAAASAKGDSEAKSRSVIVFGDTAEPVLNQQNPQGVLAFPAVDGRASNLPDALKMAGILLAGQPGQILIASDGLAEQSGKTSAAVTNLAAQGHTLDIVPVEPRSMENDLALGGLIAPRNLWTGTHFDLLVPVMGGDPTVPVQLELKINGQTSGLTAEPAESGSETSQLYRFQIGDLPEGMVTLDVTAISDDPEMPDPFLENNASHTVLQVFSPPRGLFVTSQPNRETAGRFIQALADNRVHLDVVAPDQLTTNLDALQQYRIIILDNLLSSQLNGEQLTAVQMFVSRMAGGLVVLGGRNSYTLGGYQGSPIEPMLPVKLEPPPRTERPPMVFQLILDRSSSMNFGKTNEGLYPIDLARESAMRAIETLQVADYLGVLTFSDESDWTFPLHQLGSEAGIQEALDAVSRIDAEGTTYMFDAMQEAVTKMSALPADAPRSRHILLLSDGQSTDGRAEEFSALASLAQQQGITISTIALGETADQEVMQSIAEAGKGRFYAVTDANDLPRVLVAESKAARSENIQAGDTSLKAAETGHPVLSGVDPQTLPLLHGYNALQSRAAEGAEDILISTSFGDPILSAWQYGLGRVAAWTSDLGEEWTAEWNTQSMGLFWAQVVRYVLVDPAQSPAQASVQVEPTRLRVDAAIYAANGEPVNLAEVRFSYAGADGRTSTYRLVQNEAGIYQADLPRPPEGAYRAVLTYTGANGRVVESPAPFAVNPPQEWLPQEPSQGQANLEAWAKTSGGRVIAMENLLQADQQAPEKQGSPSGDPLWPLLLALILVWPLEIAIRRRWLPWIS